MKFQVLCAFGILLIPGLYAEEDYNMDVFNREILEKCLNRLWTNRGGNRDIIPSGQTMEGFISLVEKVENLRNDWDIYDVSRALLKRFAFEEIEFNWIAGDWVGSQTGDYKTRWEIISKLVAQNNIPDDERLFHEEDLEEREKCTMYFMMGHAINSTFREGIDSDEDLMSNVPQDGSNHGAQQAPSNRKQVQKPREQGVVSVDGNVEQAIAISKILNALLASKNDQFPSPVHELYNIKLKDFPKDKRIDPLIGVTLGDVVSLAAFHDSKNGDGLRYFGPGGVWNSSACPTEYTLKDHVNGSTNALLRGAADGLLIADAVKQWSGKIQERSLRLSRVLRMYYSPRGLPLPESPDTRSYCSRQSSMNSVSSTDIRESVLSFFYVYMAKAHSRIDPRTEEKVNNALGHMNSALGGVEMETAECNQNNRYAPEVPVCETPSNVFVVLDSSEKGTGGYAEQENVVGLLAGKLDFGEGAGSLSVFHDFRRGGDQLERVKYNSTNPTCAACEAAWIDRRNIYSKNEGEVVALDALNKTLMDFERATDLLPGVPSKAVVYFHYGPLKEGNKNRIQGAKNVLRDGHRDTRVFMVGSDINTLQEMTSDKVITDVGNEEILAKRLVEEICQVPAIFQFNRCWDHKKTRKENENVYTGYVTPGHVQFWAFYPEYFLKSYTVKIMFKVDKGEITVCDQRNYPTPGFTGATFKKDNCKTTDGNTRELTFTYTNPCDGYHAHNCPVMNFAIIGEVKNSGSGLSVPVDCPGDDDKCRRFDQIKFQMHHDGVFCSGSDFVKSSSLILVVAAFLCFLMKE